MNASSNNYIQLVSIEGNIGSGKSTLLENLRSHYATNNSHIIFLKEPVDEWATIQDESGVTMLEKFYQNQSKYSFSFQMMAYISRLTLLKETIEKVKQQQQQQQQNLVVIITERSLFTDKMVFAQMLYDSGNMEYIQYQIYLKWFDAFIRECSVHKMIYVKTDPTICYSRMLTRSRQGENVIPLEYLVNCDLYHERMVQSGVCEKQLKLNGNTDIYENQEELQKWIQEVDTFIYTNEENHMKY